MQPTTQFNTVVSNVSMAKVLLQTVKLLESVHLFAASSGKLFFTKLVFEGRVYWSNVMFVTPADAAAVCRRVGGGFGGKATRPMPVAAACAVAAHKLGKQVRLSYNRNTDFRQNGGQHSVSFAQAMCNCILMISNQNSTDSDITATTMMKMTAKISSSNTNHGSNCYGQYNASHKTTTVAMTRVVIIKPLGTSMLAVTKKVCKHTVSHKLPKRIFLVLAFWAEDKLKAKGA